ncbi:MAG TPA: hypothetical protein VN648_02580 [Candidatus Methylomirabilis sp.]|nr:hypothetical protein [Candidatus Methylomirabilis sp.]
MRRRTFDRLVSTEGLVLVPVLAVAGGLLSWARRYITGEVHDQLAAQKIYFPASNSPEIAAPEFEAVRQYAGQQLTTGDQAKVYADRFIANHLEALGGGKTYAELSGEALARPDDPDLAAKVQLMFRGETSRGLLLNAYAFGKMGNIAGYAAIAAFAGAGVLLVFSLLGFYHASKVTPDQ